MGSTPLHFNVTLLSLLWHITDGQDQGISGSEEEELMLHFLGHVEQNGKSERELPKFVTFSQLPTLNCSPEITIQEDLPVNKDG